MLRFEEIMPEIEKALQSGWIGLGPKVAEFEKAIENYIGGEVHCCALNSCTAALHLAVKSLNLPPKSRILTTPITFISTNHAISYCGHEPVFCDVEPRTGNINAESINKAISFYNPDAIMVVHIGGYPCDMEAINTIAAEARIPVIEDCAHAFGAKYEGGLHVGNSENTCCLSFHAVKNLPIGDGGAIVSKDRNLIEWCKKQRWLGIDKDTISRSTNGYSWEYDVEELGYKYHLSDIAAIIGIEQIKHIDSDNFLRETIANEYRFKISKKVVRPKYSNKRLSSYHFYPMFFEKRNEVYDRLIKAGIYPGIHYKMNNKYKVYEKCKCMDLTGAEEYERTELTLPLHLYLMIADRMKIIDAI